MTNPATPGGAGRPRPAGQLLQAARRRGAQIRRRRRIAAGAVAACVAGGVAAALLVSVPGQAKQKIEVAGRPSGPSQQCPASAFVFSPLQPAPAGGLAAGPGLSHGRYAHLGAGQSTVLYQGKGADITLVRGVNPNAFAISLYAHGPKPLTPIEVLGAPTYFYPPGAGLSQGRIPFRYPETSGISDACARYQIAGSGVAEPALIATAERFQALNPSPDTPSTVEGSAPPPSRTTPSPPPTTAPSSTTTTTTVAPGPAPNPVASPFNRCPSPAPLSFGQNATADAIATVRAAVPQIYTNINTAGYRITSAAPAGGSGYGAIPAGMCGALVGARTYVVQLSFPAMAPSASLSQGQLFVSRFGQGWQVWYRYH